MNPLRWRGLAETREFYTVVDLNLMEEFDPSRAAILYKAEPGAAIQAANSSPVFRDFFNFSQFPWERSTPLSEPQGAIRVEVLDLRFGAPAQPRFMAVADVNSRLQVIRSLFTF